MAINSVGTNNFVGFTQPTFNTQQTTQTGQTGFQAGSTFGTGQANFAALGSPDLASGGGLAQVITALKDIVSALGTLVKALQAQQAGGAEGAQAKPAEGGAGGTENAQAKPAATDNIAPGEQNAQTKPADGGAGGAAPAGGTGGADAAQAGGDKMSALMQMLPNLLQVLQQLIEALSGNKDEEAKADGAKKNGKGGGAHTTHASDKAKQHAAANSAVGQQAAMEKIQQAVTQLLGAIVQMLVPLLKELTSSMGGEQNPQAQAAATQVNDALKNLGGGGMLGGVLQR